jgi:hypothetical protein
MNDELKIQKLEKVGYVGGCQSSASGYASYMESRWSTPTPERVAAYALEKLEEARKKDIDAHERNIPLMEINKAVEQKITALMKEVGMPDGWSEVDRKSRARFPKQIHHSAGYISDLMREVRTDDGFAYATSTYERLKASYTQYAECAKLEAEQKRTEAERQRNAEESKRRADMELAAILVRYGLDVMATWRDVVDELRTKDKYLDLAIAGQRVRADWSEGPGEVEDALGRFAVQNARDQEIYDDLSRHLEDFEDGRCFRDTEWSYGALFGLVEDKQLLNDCQLAEQRAGD